MSLVSPAFELAPIPSIRHQRLDERMRVCVYISGSTSLMNFLKPLGATAYYISVSGRRDVMRRIENRRDLAHGSVLADPGNRHDGAVTLDLGHEHFLSQIKPAYLGSDPLPPGLDLIDGILEIDLPSGASTTAFDKALARALAPRNLNTWLGTPDGQSRMIEAGYNPAHRLHTDYLHIGEAPRRSIVTEAFLFRPRKEMQGLIDIIAQVKKRF